MSATNTLTPNDLNVIQSIRIPSGVVDIILKEVSQTIAGETGYDMVAKQAEVDPQFSLRAVKLTQDILVATTLAKTLESDSEFVSYYQGSSFSNQDPILRQMGKVMMKLICAIPSPLDSSITHKSYEQRIQILDFAI